MGDKVGFLRFAIKELQNHPQITVEKISSLYITAPWGACGQDDYCNCVVAVVSELSPQQLLAYINKVEAAAGRIRDKLWAPRQLDIDILLYDELTLAEDSLVIPHPRMCERLFVLVPLKEAAGNIKIPGHGYLDDLMQTCKDEQRVEKVQSQSVWYEGLV